MCYFRFRKIWSADNEILQQADRIFFLFFFIFLAVCMRLGRLELSFCMGLLKVALVLLAPGVMPGTSSLPLL